MQTRLGEAEVRMAALGEAASTRFDLLESKVDNVEPTEGADCAA